LIPPISTVIALVRAPVFIVLAVVPSGHAPVTHQDQGYGTIDQDSFPAPGALSAPENRRCPTVSTSLTAVRNSTTVNRNLACGHEDRANLLGLTFEAYPSAMPVPCSAVRAPVLFIQGTAFVVEERRRRPNQEQWLEARHLSGLAAPSSIIQRPWSC
jgi:hypothetical protein